MSTSTVLKKLSMVTAGAGITAFFAIQPFSAAQAATLVELEADGTAVNNSLATAQAIPSSAFTTPVPPTVFPNAANDPSQPQFPTATVLGRNGGSDVDFFSFQANAGRTYFDIDNSPVSFDTILSLFDSAGTLLAFGDDSFPEDPGTNVGFDSFLGVFNLSAAGTYYIAVSQFNNFPSAAFTASSFSNLTRPDSGFGGFSVAGVETGNSSFESNGVQLGSPYTLHISTAVPEPASVLGLLTVGALGAGSALKRKQKQLA